MSLTSREQEIMKILTNNPMISQEELATALCISRSAAAVHISNLIKKGKIVGRGYVLSENKSIIVLGQLIGGINVKEQHISFSLNGIGFLLGSGLAKMGESVSLIAAVGDDFIGRALINELQIETLDKKHLLISNELGTTLEVIENNQHRKNSDNATKAITVDYIETKEHLFKNAHTIVNDCSLGVDITATILRLSNKYDFPTINVLNDVKDITPFFSTKILLNLDTVIMHKNQLN
ncbi:MAG: PfkB family carbohydrate kinase, partial [Bacillota bacterium]|nr:PfkB family carbohydrate kinase [Bacillota bacterium]